MSLTKDDLTKIKNVVNASAEVTNARIDKFEENVNRRFEENDRQHDRIIAKVDQLFKTEHEDILAVYEDIDIINTKLKKANI